MAQRTGELYWNDTDDFTHVLLLYTCTAVQKGEDPSGRGTAVLVSARPCECVTIDNFRVAGVCKRVAIIAAR